MSKLLSYLFGALLIPVAVVLVGCGQSTEQGPTSEPSQPAAEEPQHDHDHGDHDGHDHDSHAGHSHNDHAMHSEYEGESSKLPPEDHVLAERQKVCPVSGDPLGSMGVPYKVTVQGRKVLLCCQGCEDAIKENPEKYLAKLPR